MGGAHRQCSLHTVNQSDFTEVLTLLQGSHVLKSRITISKLVLKAALNLTFLNDIEMLPSVTLVENVLTRAHLHHFKPIDQSKLIELLEALEELYLVKIL